MTPADKAALRALAVDAWTKRPQNAPAEWNAFRAAAHPAAVLALLDENARLLGALVSVIDMFSRRYTYEDIQEELRMAVPELHAEPGP